MRRLAAALVVAAGATAPLLVAPAASGTDRAVAAAVDPAAVEVLITTLTPLAPRPTSTITIGGSLRNASSEDLTGLRLQVLEGGTLSRFDLHQQRDDPQRPPYSVGTLVPGPDRLAAGEQRAFRIKVKVKDLPRRDDGVHPLAVEASTSAGAVGRVHTFLPLFAHAPSSPTRIAWVVPVDDRPQVGPDGDLLDATTLAALVRPQGRLSRVLAAGADTTSSELSGRRTPVTWAIEPSLLGAIETAARGEHRARSSNQRGFVTLAKDARAEAWLSVLVNAVEDDGVLPLPYGDADVVSLDAAGLRDEAVSAIQASRSLLTRSLGVAVSAGVAWPDDGLVSPGALDALAAADATTVLLDERAIPPAATLPYTASSSTAVASAEGLIVQALVADTEVSRLVAQGSGAAATPRLAEQLFLAETAMITAQRPSSAQAILVLPPRDWEPGPSVGRAQIADSSSVPWLEAVSVRELVERAPAVSRDRGPLAFSAADAEALVPPDLLRSAADLRSQVRDVASVFAEGVKQSLTPPIEQSLYSVESASGRDDPDASRALLDSAQRALDRLRAKVRASAPKVVTVTSQSSKVPVTLVNDLGADVHVRLSVDAENRAKLRSSFSQAVTIPARAKVRIDVPVEVQSAGTFPVVVSLTTPQGGSLGEPRRFIVRSAAYGGLALGITIGALAVLVIAVVVRTVRQVRARRDRPAAHRAAP